ncbi:UbiX family flavin prenyltransferase [Pseudooceanicola sp.]|uniref:UbiX family flavin prenyltransferase n=1 Tax=Pseudooceanicola sp. TaxID=1914328 RepID=UPI0026194DFB|nr:UbiX family flavin prenyltransferase [Pseudooceanicola sp.]MDF1854663.1 UbiX family flavin prenyltransferase [Pseudooceanicola sp.]
MTRIVLGVSGASGAALALATARLLVTLGIEIDLVVSPAAERTLREECGAGALAELTDLADQRHGSGDIGARIASGSAPLAGMIVAPCSMRSLAAIANGLDDNLITRAASVQLKERRPLILLAREAPLTLAHLRNMTAATEMGAIVLPPVPAFYLKPQGLNAVVDQIAARAVDLLRLGPQVAQGWTG